MRFVCAFVIVVVATTRELPAQTGGWYDSRGDRASLIEGVRAVTAPGSPGSLAVFAPTASAIVVGKSDGDCQVAVIASTHLGRGRVVAFAHDGYFAAEHLKAADSGKLLTNAVRWAAADKPRPRVGLIDGHALEALIEKQGGRRAGAARPACNDTTSSC